MKVICVRNVVSEIEPNMYRIMTCFSFPQYGVSLLHKYNSYIISFPLI